MRQFLHWGRRFLWLSLLVSPIVFLPFALYCGLQANRRGEQGEGSRILLASILIAGLAGAGLALWIYLERGSRP